MARIRQPNALSANPAESLIAGLMRTDQRLNAQHTGVFNLNPQAVDRLFQSLQRAFKPGGPPLDIYQEGRHPGSGGGINITRDGRGGGRLKSIFHTEAQGRGVDIAYDADTNTVTMERVRRDGRDASRERLVIDGNTGRGRLTSEFHEAGRVRAREDHRLAVDARAGRTPDVRGHQPRLERQDGRLQLPEGLSDRASSRAQRWFDIGRDADPHGRPSAAWRPDARAGGDSRIVWDSGSGRGATANPADRRAGRPPAGREGAAPDGGRGDGTSTFKIDLKRGGVYEVHAKLSPDGSIQGGMTITNSNGEPINRKLGGQAARGILDYLDKGGSLREGKTIFADMNQIGRQGRMDFFGTAMRREQFMKSAPTLSS